MSDTSKKNTCLYIYRLKNESYLPINQNHIILNQTEDEWKVKCRVRGKKRGDHNKK